MAARNAEFSTSFSFSFRIEMLKCVICSIFGYEHTYTISKYRSIYLRVSLRWFFGEPLEMFMCWVCEVQLQCSCHNAGDPENRLNNNLHESQKTFQSKVRLLGNYYFGRPYRLQRSLFPFEIWSHNSAPRIKKTHTW